MSDAEARAGAVLFVDLDAMAANWRALKTQLRAGTRMAAVVKADAYGLGATHAAPALAAAGCTRFCVATLDDAIALGAFVPKCEILVFAGPFAGSEADFLACNALPVLNSPEQIARWTDFARKSGKRLPAALHVDTGMSRLGLTAAETKSLATDRDTLATIDLKLVMSHLACAEETAHPMNALQRDRLIAARALFPGVEASLAASSGIFLGPDWHFDWVRPGAAIYGVNPTPGRPNPMRQVIELKARIVQTRDIDPGESVGYGATWRAPRRTRLAVVAAGYADGLLRSLSNRGSAFLGETRVPLVGRVSMDLMVFDVGDAPEAQARAGEFVTLIGGANTVDAVGEAANTNGYEILTGLGHRIHRVWKGGSGR